MTEDVVVFEWGFKDITPEFLEELRRIDGIELLASRVEVEDDNT